MTSKDGFGIQNLALFWPPSNIPQADCLREKKSIFCLQQMAVKLEETWGSTKPEVTHARLFIAPYWLKTDGGGHILSSNMLSVGGQTFYSDPANAGLPACFLCNDKLSNYKKSNLERHFQEKHAKFAADYPVGSERKSAMAVLLQKLEERKGTFKKWIAQAVSLIACVAVIKALYNAFNCLRLQTRFFWSKILGCRPLN